MQSVSTILKYVVIYLVAHWALDHVMPFRWAEAAKVVASGLGRGAAAIPATRTAQGWISVIAYSLLPLFMMALCAWDLTTRKARTAR